jgi:hypothetical protein
MSKFWTEDISQLFAFRDGIIPNKKKTFSSNLNSITRFALLLCVLVSVFLPLVALGVFTIAIVVVLAIFYSTNIPIPITPIVKTRLSDDDEDDDDHEYYSGENHFMKSPPSPKTLEPLNFIPNIYDRDAFKSIDTCDKCFSFPCVCLRIDSTMHFANKNFADEHYKNNHIEFSEDMINRAMKPRRYLNL